MEKSFTRNRILKVWCANRKPPLLPWDTLPTSSGLRGRLSINDNSFNGENQRIWLQSETPQTLESWQGIARDYTPSSTKVDCLVWYKPSSSLHLFLLGSYSCSIFLCACAYVHACGHLWRPEISWLWFFTFYYIFRYPLLWFFTLYFWSSRTGWPVNFWVVPVSSQNQGYRCSPLAFDVSARDPDSGPHACPTGSSLTEPSSQPSFRILLCLVEAFISHFPQLHYGVLSSILVQ